MTPPPIGGSEVVCAGSWLLVLNFQCPEWVGWYWFCPIEISFDVKAGRNAAFSNFQLQFSNCEYEWRVHILICLLHCSLLCVCVCVCVCVRARVRMCVFAIHCTCTEPHERCSSLLPFLIYMCILWHSNRFSRFNVLFRKWFLYFMRSAFLFWLACYVLIFIQFFYAKLSFENIFPFVLQETLGYCLTDTYTPGIYYYFLVSK